jgi:hypothetical protein
MNYNFGPLQAAPEYSYILSDSRAGGNQYTVPVDSFTLHDRLIPWIINRLTLGQWSRWRSRLVDRLLLIAEGGRY